MTAAISGISEYNKDLVQKYQREMKLRKKYHNELVELKGKFFTPDRRQSRKKMCASWIRGKAVECK